VFIKNSIDQEGKTYNNQDNMASLPPLVHHIEKLLLLVAVAAAVVVQRQ
jgi:hypothetical protein